MSTPADEWLDDDILDDDAGVGIVFAVGGHHHTPLEWHQLGRVRVLTLVRNSPAEKCGRIRQGDILKRVDGKDVEATDLKRIRAMCLGPVGSCITFEFERNGSVYVQTLTRVSSSDDKQTIESLRRRLAAEQSARTAAEERARKAEMELMLAQRGGGDELLHMRAELAGQLHARHEDAESLIALRKEKMALDTLIVHLRSEVESLQTEYDTSVADAKSASLIARDRMDALERDLASARRGERAALDTINAMEAELAQVRMEVTREVGVASEVVEKGVAAARAEMEKEMANLRAECEREITLIRSQEQETRTHFENVVRTRMSQLEQELALARTAEKIALAKVDHLTQDIGHYKQDVDLARSTSLIATTALSTAQAEHERVKQAVSECVVLLLQQWGGVQHAALANVHSTSLLRARLANAEEQREKAEKEVRFLQLMVSDLERQNEGLMRVLGLTEAVLDQSEDKERLLAQGDLSRLPDPGCVAMLEDLSSSKPAPPVATQKPPAEGRDTPALDRRLQATWV